jgi:hypothetical protein
MPVRGAFLALLLGALAAHAAELQTLKGEKLTGDVVRITDKEIVLTRGGKEVRTPVAGVLHLDFPNAKVRLEDKYADVELTDGTLLHCKEFVLKGKQAVLRTLAGQEVKIPLSGIANVLTNAQDEKLRKDWSERVARKRRRDVVAVLREGVVNPLEGTLGEGNEEGTHVEFTLGGSKRQIPLEKVHGLIFLRELDPAAPPVLCKLTDTYHDLVMVSGIDATPAGLTVTTPAGARISYAGNLVTRLDYSTDKVAYLSQLEPVKVDQPDEQDHPFDRYRRDRNLDNQPLRLGGQEHALGLALHAHTELEYNLNGDYREFKALAGIDESVSGRDGPVVLIIEGDGKALYTKTFTRKNDKKPTPVALNIKDVQKLRIVVTSGDGYDLGRHLDLVEAKVSK